MREEREWKTWTREDVGEWLDALGLAKYIEVFLENEITGDVLPELSHDVLREELGITAFGHRVRIINAVKVLCLEEKLMTFGTESSSASATTTVTTTVRVATGASTAAVAAAPANAVPSRDANSLDLLVLHAAPLVIADAKGRIFPMEKLDLEAERRAITNSLLTDVQHKAIHVRFDVATADILRSLMTAWKCRVLHFSGHGLGQQKPALCFEDGAGRTHMITPDLLRQLTFSGDHRIEQEFTPSNHKRTAHDHRVQLVFVNSCHSEKVASVFLNAGIPHVVAVHSDSLVVDASATMFAKHFYLSLFSGHTVRTAFEIAKGAVRALPTQPRAACCCAKFLLLGGNGCSEAHDVVLFGDIPNGELRDYTPKYKSSIPSMHGQFIGRNTETYLLVKSLLEKSVTACLGAPGIGKSSLVISVAHFVHNRRMFPDGVYYVDLEGQKLSTVRYAIAQSIGMPAADTNEEVFAELGSKRCLLVLDKVEELLDEDDHKTQDLFGQLLSVAPNIRLLLASRRNIQIPNVTSYSLSIPELPLRTATELLCLVAPNCSPKLAERLAKICGCLPLAIRVVGRALANARMTVTPEQMIEYLERDEGRFETIKELNQVGHKECVDRCIRSSFCHLDEPLRLAFMALGFFRGSFDVDAANAVLSSPFTESNGSSRSLSSSSSGSSFFPGFAYANSRRSQRDDEIMSVKSLGSQLSNLDEFGFDNDGAMTNESYDLLDLESVEEEKARSIIVPSAKVALQQLHQWSLVEFNAQASRYRMHNLVQLFAEDEAGRMGESSPSERSPPISSAATSFVSASIGSPSSFPLGQELLITWKRRFVRYYCMIVATASHAYRFDGTLSLFDKERPNIESAMRLAHDLTIQSIERIRERKRKRQEDRIDDEVNGDGGDSSVPAQPQLSKSEGSQQGLNTKPIIDSSIVDALLYSNLVVRCRFIFRARVEPRRRIQVVSSCLQLSREARSLNCTCGNSENDPSIVLWDVEEAKYERELWILDELPSFEEEQKPKEVPAGCSCVGIRELIALEAILLTDLGYACCDVTDWVAGEYHYLESLRLQRDVLGWADHSQVAEVLNQFGICLSTRWGYLAYNIWLLKHAERLLKGSLMMRKRVLGDDHPEYATSLNNLANFYKNCNPASSSGKRRVVISNSIHSDETVVEGKDPPLRRSSLSRYSSEHSSAGSIESESTSSSVTDDAESKDGLGTEQSDIEELYRLSLKIREARLGANHPQVAQSLNNLALFLSNSIKPGDNETERRAEIGRLYDRALSIRRSTLGNASFETAATLNNMGNFKRITGDWRGAEDNIKEALKITNRYFNDISPRAARIYINLARVYKDQKRYDEAIAAYQKAQEIRQKLFPDTRDVGYCIEQIGKVLRLQGKEEEGKKMEDEGRRLKKLGLSPIPEGAESGIIGPGGETPNTRRFNVNVRDVMDAEALLSRKFNFPGKLLGERGIHLKKIEAISCAQLRYFGPWPSGGKKHYSGNHSVEEASIQITSTSEQTLARAKDLAIEHLREIKVKWEQFVNSDQRHARSPHHHHHNHYHHPERSRSSSNTPPHHRPGATHCHYHSESPSRTPVDPGGGGTTSNNPQTVSPSHGIYGQSGGGHLHLHRNHYHHRGRGGRVGSGPRGPPNSPFQHHHHRN